MLGAVRLYDGFSLHEAGTEFRVQFVIAVAFYPLLLTVTRKFGIYFQLTELSVTRGDVLFCAFCANKSTGSIPMLYGVNSTLVLLITSVFSCLLL